MYCAKISPSDNRQPSLRGFAASLWLFILSFIGCFHSSQVVEDSKLVSHSKIHPIDVDTFVTESIGREALEKVGYDEIIKLADRARFVEYKYSTNIELISYSSQIAADFTPVFSRYAVAAAVTSQADSPLPGPADIAAIGVLVLGLVDAGLLDGYLLNTVSAWLIDSGRLQMSENVIDTGVMEQVRQLIAAAAATGIFTDECTVLEQLYKEAQGSEKRKIQATQKGMNCRNKQKRR